MSQLWKEIEREEQASHLEEVILNPDDYIAFIHDYERDKINSFFQKFEIDNKSDGEDIILDGSPYRDRLIQLKPYSNRLLFFDSACALQDIPDEDEDEDEDENESVMQYCMTVLILKDTDDWFWVTCLGWSYAQDYYDIEEKYFFKCDQLRGILELLNSDFFKGLAYVYLQKKKIG